MSCTTEKTIKHTDDEFDAPARLEVCQGDAHPEADDAAEVRHDVEKAQDEPEHKAVLEPDDAIADGVQNSLQEGDDKAARERRRQLC